MANAAVLKLGMAQAASRPFSLYIDGLDVLIQDGAAPQFGVDLDSIIVTEAGPGAVSQLDFTYIDRTGSAWVPAAGAEIRFTDNTNDLPLFLGTVNNYSVAPFPSGTGRTLAVSCDGIEKVLDDKLVLNESFLPIINGIQSVTAHLGHRYTTLNATLGTTPNGTRATPVGQLSIGADLPYLDDVFALDGVTIREGVYQTAAIAAFHPISGEPYTIAPNLTVDFYRSLRLYHPGAQPDDYTTLTVSDTVGAAIASTSLNYEVHPADIIHEVYLAGFNAAGSGWFSDGTGIRGKQAYLSDATSDTAARAKLIAGHYLADQAASVRGGLDIGEFNPASTVHAGGLVMITDSAVGLAAVTYIIASIRKSFIWNGKQRWTVAFGGRPPSAMAEIRRLTRTVLN